jgi:hypothetical protein
MDLIWSRLESLFSLDYRVNSVQLHKYWLDKTYNLRNFIRLETDSEWSTVIVGMFFTNLNDI